VGEGLFRQEVMQARRDAWLGSAQLPRSRMAWPMAILAASAMLLILLLLAFGGYTRKERVQGRLVPRAGLLEVSATTPSIVTDVLVSEGQPVEAGQPLLQLSADPDSPSLPARGVGDSIDRQLRRQRESLATELASSAESEHMQRDALGERIALLQRQLAAAGSEQHLRQRQAEDATTLVERIRPLVEERIVSVVQMQQYETAAMDASAQAQLARQQHLQVQEDLNDARAQLAALPNAAGTRRGESERALADVDQAIARNDVQRSQVLRATRAGVVSGLAIGPGQPVAAGRRLLSIVPAGSPLQAELWVPSRAVGTLAIGGDVSMRYEAFPHQKFGRQPGNITGIGGVALSPDEIRARSGISVTEPSFRVVVAPGRRRITGDGGRMLSPRPGMLLEADLMLERRRLLDLLWSAPERPSAQAAAPSGTTH